MQLSGVSILVHVVDHWLVQQLLDLLLCPQRPQLLTLLEEKADV